MEFSVLRPEEWLAFFLNGNEEKVAFFFYLVGEQGHFTCQGIESRGINAESQEKQRVCVEEQRGDKARKLCWGQIMINLGFQADEFKLHSIDARDN